ncbi:MAG: MscL family protein [Acidobacteriota bacterium]
MKEAVHPRCRPCPFPSDYEEFFRFSSLFFPFVYDRCRRRHPELRLFINTVIRFLIIGFSIFLVVKWVNALKAKDEEAPAEPTTKECPFENI